MNDDQRDYMRRGTESFLCTVAFSHKPFDGKRRYTHLPWDEQARPHFDGHRVRMVRVVDPEMVPRTVETEIEGAHYASINVPVVRLWFVNTPGFRSFQDTVREMQRQDEFLVSRLGTERTIKERLLYREDERIRLWHSGWRARVHEDGRWEFEAKTAAVRIMR